jgi:uncharacterized protein
VLHVWVTARAVEGRANRAVVRAVARGLGVRASAVALVGGERGRDKLLEVEGGGAGPTSGTPGRS